MRQLKKIRIGIDARPLVKPEKTGIQYYTWHLVNHLAALETADHEFFLFYHNSGFRQEPEHFPCPEDPRFHRVIIRLLDFRQDRFSFWWEKVLVPYHLRRLSIDVYHGTSFYLPSSRFSRMVVTVHDLAFLKPLTSQEPSNIHHLKNGLVSALSRADRVITVSEHTKKDVVREFHVSPDRVNVIYHGVLDDFQPETSFSKSQLTLGNRELPDKIILFVGTLDPRKNLTTLLRAFAQVREHAGLDYHLVLAGKPGMDSVTVADLVKTLEMQPFVHIADYVPEEDLPALYRAADLFVYPSLYEGFGLPVLEAMASGVPVVASQTSSLPEVVGDAGLLVEPTDPAAFAKAMVAVLTDEGLRADLKHQGLIQAKKFRWEETARQTLGIYEEAYRKQ